MSATFLSTQQYWLNIAVTISRSAAVWPETAEELRRKDAKKLRRLDRWRGWEASEGNATVVTEDSGANAAEDAGEIVVMDAMEESCEYVVDGGDMGAGGGGGMCR